MSDLALHKLQGFEIRRIARSQIMDAPYNPRRIAAGNKERLAKGLSKHKLVIPPLWNARTGNLVSGHQRLAILDDKAKGADYLLDVASIDVDEKEEVQLNILLNNESAMGEFDNSALKDLAVEFSFDLGDVGFSREDLYINFDLEKELAPEKTPEAKQAIKERRNEEKAEYAQQKAQSLTHDSEAKQDYMVQLVFPTNMAAVEYLRAHGLDATKRTFPSDLWIEATTT